MTRKMTRLAMRLFLGLCLGCELAAGANLEPLTLEGSVQLWTKACSAPSRCDLPVAAGEPEPVLGIVGIPGPKTPAVWQGLFELGDVDVRILIVRKARTKTELSYTSYQVTLQNRTTQKVLAECSSYEPEHASGVFFPVGACSGSSTGWDRVGVTFRRRAPPHAPTLGY